MQKNIIYIFIFLFLLSPIKLLACTCIVRENNTVKAEVRRSDVVLAGKIISKTVFEIHDSIIPEGIKYFRAAYMIQISKIYKGKLESDTVQVITGIGGDDCGVEFDIGSNYIIYGEFSNKYFQRGRIVGKYLKTDICTRTKKYDKKESRRIKRYMRFGY